VPVRGHRPRPLRRPRRQCTLCYDRLEDGLEPACAKACPTDSIQFGPYDELVGTAKGRVVALHEKGVESAGMLAAFAAAGGTLAAMLFAHRRGGR
jgi:Fe-S-cluster-containing dehydrogenase component